MPRFFKVWHLFLSHMKTIIKDFARLSRGEKKGLFFLSLLLITSIFLKNYLNYLSEKQAIAEISKINFSLRDEESAPIQINYARTEHYENQIKEQKNTYYAKQENKPNSKNNKIIELNSADSVDLEELPGIGFTLAGRIIKYRDRLGGFYDKKQLLEVWGLKEEFYLKFEKKLKVDTILIKKIHFTSEDSFWFKHPYIEKKSIRIIKNYLKQHGKISDWEELKKVSLMQDTTMQKLYPYINFNPKK